MKSFGNTTRRLWDMARKELLQMFETPVAYIVIVLFLGVSEFIFFKSVFLVGEASLSLYYNFLPWVFLLVVPALAMGMFAQEREVGTYETLTTNPLSELEIILGKLVALKIVFASALALVVIPTAIAFSFFADLDWGVLFVGYVASLLLAILFSAISLTISSLFTKQVSSFLVTVAILFFLNIASTDLVAGSVPVKLTQFFESVSTVSHFTSMTRGVIDVRDVWYFVSIVVVFVVLAVYRMVSTRYGARHHTRITWRTGLTLIVVAVLVSNILGSRIPGRLDFTADKAYTLSVATTEMLSELPDLITLTLYASALPPQLQPVLRDVRDVLKDYERYGKGSVTVQVKDPSADSDLAKQAESEGVQPVQFNVMGQGELSVKQGYLGVVVAYGGEQRVVPFIDQTSGLEYQLTSLIHELTVTEKKQVAFVSGYGEKSRYGDLSLFSGELEKQYQVSDLMLDEEIAASTSVEVADVLIVADPTEPYGTSTLAFLDRYVRDGGTLLTLGGGAQVDERALSAQVSTGNLKTVLDKFGIIPDDGVVYDLGSNETVQLQAGGGMYYLVDYAFWARAGTLPSLIKDQIVTVMMPWTSEVKLDTDVLASLHATATPLITTSPYAGVMREPYSLAPETTLSETELDSRILAYMVQSEDDTPLRIVSFGGPLFLTDSAVEREAANLALGLSAVSWLAQEPSFAAIKIKGGQHRTFQFESATEQSLVAYGNMALAILLPLLLGLFVYWRRSRLTKLTYSDRPIL